MTLEPGSWLWNYTYNDSFIKNVLRWAAMTANREQRYRNRVKSIINHMENDND